MDEHRQLFSVCHHVWVLDMNKVPTNFSMKKAFVLALQLVFITFL